MPAFFCSILFFTSPGKDKLAALARLAVHAHASPQVGSAMLDNRQPQAGAAYLFRMAFIHPVEAFKDALLLRLRNTDSRVLHRNLRAVLAPADCNCNRAALAVIFDSIFAEIIKDLL